MGRYTLPGRSTGFDHCSALGTAAHARTGETTTMEGLTEGYALGMTLGAVLLVGAVLIAFTVLPRTSTASPAEHGSRDSVPEPE
ncbi:hypothetical protein ACQP2K_14330 [Microbispora siamensis]